MNTMTARRKRQNDGYDQDDILRDGEFLRVPMTLADAAMRGVVHHQHPPATGRFFYGRGFLTDTGSHRVVDARDEATKAGLVADQRIKAPKLPSGVQPNLPGNLPWVSANRNVYSYWGHAIGEECECPDGTKGRLAPHPNQSSLFCQPLAEDAASVYYRMKDAAQHEWKRHGPRHDACCDGCADQAGTVGAINPQLAWPTGQHENGACMTDDRRQGTLRQQADGSFRCVANDQAGNGRDSAEAVAVGPGPWPIGSLPEGMECSCEDGSIGRLVKVDNQLVCLGRNDIGTDARTVNADAAQGIRDRAYAESVRAAEQAWKQW
jgi:hypothetical protein